MPHLSLSIVQAGGPLIDVLFGISAPRMATLTKQGQGSAIPKSIRVRALIDTGASHTCVDPGVAMKLNLVAKGTAPIHTPSTQGVPHVCKVFDISLIIPLANNQAFAIQTMAAAESNLAPQGIDALIGRDVLAHATMFYDGPTGTITVSF